MVVITGGAGFIGSVFAWKLNEEGIDDIIIVDHLDDTEKWNNLVHRKFKDYLSREIFLSYLVENRLPYKIDAIIHLGACSSTTEKDSHYLMENNYRYTKMIMEWAVQNDVYFMYASSAAIYRSSLTLPEKAQVSLPIWKYFTL